jgi:hypothetical protein
MLAMMVAPGEKPVKAEADPTARVVALLHDKI